jgi:hypothetical protein
VRSSHNVPEVAEPAQPFRSQAQLQTRLKSGSQAPRVIGRLGRRPPSGGRSRQQTLLTGVPQSVCRHWVSFLRRVWVSQFGQLAAQLLEEFAH